VNTQNRAGLYLAAIVLGFALLAAVMIGTTLEEIIFAFLMLTVGGVAGGFIVFGLPIYLLRKFAPHVGNDTPTPNIDDPEDEYRFHS
jgi:hypothetical protein